MNLLHLIIKKEKKSLIQKRHPWIYSGAIKHIPKELKQGDVCALACEQGNILAYGAVNPKASIVFRVLSFEANFDPSHLIEKRIIKAVKERRDLISKDTTNAYRLINAEADGLPGLIVDIYSDVAAIQISTAFIDKNKQELIDAIVKHAKIKAIYEKSTAKSRSLEGLESFAGWLYGNEQKDISIYENGLTYQVDVISGQKTGFFLDQRQMRFLVRTLSMGQSVLNCFSYTGGFSLNAIIGGARSVTSVDSSESASEKTKLHEQINNLTGKTDHKIICADAFKFLKETNETFDLIILDPPPFVKKSQDITKGFKHYLELNRLGMNALKPSGMLLTFSCSPFFSEEDFLKMISMAAALESRSLRVISNHLHGYDHPVLINHPEGKYLKGYVLKEQNYDR